MFGRNRAQLLRHARLAHSNGSSAFCSSGLNSSIPSLYSRMPQLGGEKKHYTF